MLLPQLFRQSVARTPERTAVANLETREEMTYAELNEQVTSIVAGLRHRGVEPGDRVTICMANRPEHVALLVATQMAGVVATPFNFRLPADGVRYHVDDSDPALFVFGPSTRDAVIDAADAFDVDSVYIGDDCPNFAEPFAALAEAEPSTESSDVSIGPEDPSVMLYSSGTTGDPKGIPLTHEATVGRVIANSLGQRYYLEETMIGIMPLYHTVGLHGILFGLLSMSGTYLCMPQFDPETCVQAIEDYSVTALHEAPTIFVNLLDTDAIDEVDVSSVRAVGYSGAPMSQAAFDRTLKTFNPDHIANLYGTTEAYGTLAYVDLHDIDDPTVTGPANIGYEVRIVEIGDTDPDAIVNQGEQGELVVNTDSPISFNEYWNKPDRTAEAVHEGWFFTGDVARRTEAGNTVITGRVGDMIISGGENIHPSEVEDALASHPNVTDIGVIGMDDEEWGEVVTAFVVTESDVDEETLDEWCRRSDELADYKRPRAYRFVEEIPRNPSGKILRHDLQDRHEVE